ncbi:hypothetical protein ACM64Y_00660 [Novispirillum sp. DQ9]|uniref:hypothetical protein n=1 Tax=Novispirillum sp. DQ9 TaxID=3398612 RepID=UPI003C7CA309
MATTSQLVEAMLRLRLDNQISAGSEAAAASLKKVGDNAELAMERVGKAAPSLGQLNRQLDETAKAAARVEGAERKLEQQLSSIRREVEAGRLTEERAAELRRNAVADRDRVAMAASREAARLREAREAAIAYANGLSSISAVAGQNASSLDAMARSAEAINMRMGIGQGPDIAARAADIEAYGAALDGLRAKYNPLFAAEQAHLAAMEDIAQAARVGAINEIERSVAVDKATESYRKQAAAIDAAKQASINETLGVRDDFDYDRRAADIEAYARSLDALEARFDPVIAAERRYRSELDDAATAHRLGALTADQYAAAVARIDDTLNPATVAARQQDAALEQLKGSLDTAHAASLQLSKAQGILDAAMERGALSAQEHARLMGLAKERAESLGQGMGASAKGFHNFQMFAQQAGYQIADFSVQVASGQNAIIAFIQQATQVIQFMGPMGAVIGAAGAVVGGLAVGLMGASDAADGAGKSMDALGRTIAGQAGEVEDLTARYRALTEAQANLERINLLANQQKALREYRDALKEMEGAIRDAVGDKYWMDFDGRWTDQKLAPVVKVMKDMHSGALDADEGLQALEVALRRTGLMSGFTSEQMLNAAGNVGALGKDVQSADEFLDLLGQTLAGTGRATSSLSSLAPDLASFIDKVASAENAAPGMRALADAMREVEGVKLTGQAIEALNAGLIDQSQFDQVYAAIQRFMDVGDKMFEKPSKDADEFRKRIESLTDSLDPVGAATRKYQADLADLTKAGLENSDLADELVRRYGTDLVSAWEQVDGKTKDVTDTFREHLATLDRQNEYLRLEVEGRASVIPLLQDQVKLEEQLGRALTEEEKAGLAVKHATRERLEEQKKLQDEAAKEAKRANEAAVREAERMVDNITKYGADKLVDGIMDPTRKSWKDMLDGMLRDLSAFFLRAAAEAMLRPIAVQMVGQFMGTAGAVGGSASGGAAAGGQGGGLFGGVGDVLSAGRSIFSAGNGSLMPGLDSWAQSTFGWGSIGLSSVGAAGFGSAAGGAAASLGVAAVPGGITNAAATAPGLLNGGSALAGFGSLSNVLGIGGAILPGLISGNYVQAAAGGIGAAIGTAILPGIGTAIGGLLGNLAGGFFGGGDEDIPYAGVDTRLSPGGRISVASTTVLDGADAGPVRDAGRRITEAFATTLDAIGGSIEETLRVWVSSGRDVGQAVAIGDNVVKFDRANDKQFANAFRELIRAGDVKVEGDRADILNATRLKVDGLEQLVQRIQFVQNFDASTAALRQGYTDPAEVAGAQAAAQVKALTAQFQEFLKLTRETSMPLNEARGALQEYVKTLTGLKDAPEPLGPIDQAIAEIKARGEELPDLFKAVGLSAALAERAVNTMLDKLQEQVVQGTRDAVRERWLGRLTQQQQLWQATRAANQNVPAWLRGDVRDMTAGAPRGDDPWQEYRAIVGGLNEALRKGRIGLQDYSDAVATVTGLYDAAAGVFRDLEQSADAAAEAERALVQARREAMAGAMATWRQAWLSTLSPQQVIRQTVPPALRGQFRDVLDAGGQRAALGEYRDALESLNKALRSGTLPLERYQSLTEILAQTYEYAAGAAQQQIDAIRAANDNWRQAWLSTLSPQQVINTLVPRDLRSQFTDVLEAGDQRGALREYRDGLTSLNDALRGGSLTVERYQTLTALLAQTYQEAAGAAQQAAQAQRDARQSAAGLIADQMGGLRDYVRDLTFGEASALSPTQRLAEAQRQFLGIAGAARGGDYESLTQVRGASEAFLSVAREFYGTGTQYDAAYAQVVDALQGIATQDRETLLRNTIETTSRTQVETMRDGFADLVREVRGLRAETAQMRRQLRAAA